MIRDSFYTLSAVVILLIFLRFSRSKFSLEHLWFGLTVVFFFLRVFFNNYCPLRFTFSMLFVWSGGCYLYYLLGERRVWLWSVANIVAYITIVIFAGLGYHLRLSFDIFYIITFTGLSAYPLWLLYRYFRQTSDYLFLFFFIVLIIWLLSSLYELGVSVLELRESDFIILPSLFFMGGILYLLTEGIQGYSVKIDKKNQLVRNAYSRLIQTENTLRLQDRLAAAGLLASGSVHEIKNLLNSIGTSAEYGRRQKNIADKDRAFDLIEEHVRIGNETVSNLLEKIISQGREKPEVVKPKEDMKLLYRMLRVTYRADEIRVVMDFPSDFTVYARRGELEQILLNLVRNAVESFKRNRIEKERYIKISGFEKEGNIVIDVTDNAGGIPEELVPRIFKPAFSGSNGTGLGLYLAKTLVERNGGEIEYIPVDGGSRFRLIFLKR